MESLKCEHVSQDGTLCLIEAEWGCKLEKVAICSNHFIESHLGGLHEKISVNEVVKLVCIEEGLTKISKLHGHILGSGSDIIGFISKIVGATEKKIIERGRKMNELMNALGSNQEILNSVNSLSNVSFRLSNKAEVLKAIEYYFAENDGIVYKDKFQDILNSIYKSSIQGNEQIAKLGQAISNNQEENMKKIEEIEKTVDVLKKNNESLKNEIKSLKEPVDRINGMKQEIESLNCNCVMQINTLREQYSKKIETLKKKHKQIVNLLEGDLKNLKQDLNIMKMNDKFSKVTEKMNDLRGKLENFQTSVFTSDSIRSFKAKVEKLNSRYISQNNIESAKLFAEDLEMIFKREYDGNREVIIEAILKMRKRGLLSQVSGIKISHDRKLFICKD